MKDEAFVLHMSAWATTLERMAKTKWTYRLCTSHFNFHVTPYETFMNPEQTFSTYKVRTQKHTHTHTA
jgi:hypothetical protein